MSNDPTRAPQFDAHQHARSMAQTLDLTIDDAWHESIATNLVMLEEAAQLVLAVTLPDDIESALVYKPLDQQSE